MLVNENGKYTESAEYFYNEFNDLYCIIGTTYSAQTVADLENLFENPALLHEVKQPDYITADYDAQAW